MEIVLATANPHKVEEMRSIFGSLVPGGAVRLIGLDEAFGGRPLQEPAETGATFEENAAIKAAAYARQTGRSCLADDSGLEVDALGGRPGVISSHFCTDGRETGMSRGERDRANNLRLLKELEGVPPQRRTARFVCVMCLQGTGKPVSVRGTFEGRIGVPGEVPRGANGFGYDPLFLVAPEYLHTSAELAVAEKNRLSHRAAAARLMADHLRHLA
ncbi:MAG: non-canonical purine NTP pyrophosphatase [Phycisphaerae bacterium]|nr:dITP/XTP pyrophosphatase [Phycisphaerales bacterium]